MRVAPEIAFQLQTPAFEVELYHLSHQALARLLLGRALVQQGDLLASKDEPVEIESQ